MTSIQAYQHIYSNVEKEQSPRGKGGFQTLFYTHSGLTETELSEMEGRMLYFSSHVEPVKRLFFTLSTGKGVTAQIAALSDPDQFGRKGRYLAHSLIFRPEDLAQFEADPFRVFRRFSFAAAIAEALAQGDFQTGDIPPVALDLSSKGARDVEAASNWPPAELKKLALLALRVDQQARERDAITFAGNEAQIEEALEAAFLVLPLSMRPRCSFDTYFYRCNLVATYFWAVGLPEPPARIKFALVKGASREVGGDIPGQAERAYERWVLAEIEAGRLAEIARERDTAFALAEWLDGRAYDMAQLDAASPELISALFEVNSDALKAMLHRQAGELLPPLLTERAAAHIYRRAEALPLYQQLRQGFELPQLADTLYEAYVAQSFDHPPRKELKALELLLKEMDHSLLRLLWAYWTNPRKALPKELERADEAAYRQFGETALALKLVKPLHLLAPGRGDAFLELYPADKIDNWVELVEALIDVEEAASLSALGEYVAEFSEKDLWKISRLIDKEDDIPASFRQAVEEVMDAAPKKGGLKGLWRRKR